MQIKTISIAQSSTIGKADTPTGILKVETTDEIELGNLGLEGDFQADKRVHGGFEKAVYQYPFENYQSLSDALPHLAEKFSSPCIGENFSSLGMTDDKVFIGDIYRIGTALVQVSQPRMPCWKLNHHIGNAHVQALLIALNRSGWYYRVLETGKVQAGNQVTLEERIQSEYSVERIWILWNEFRERKLIEAPKVDIKGLSEEWTFDWG